MRAGPGSAHQHQTQRGEALERKITRYFIPKPCPPFCIHCAQGRWPVLGGGSGAAACLVEQVAHARGAHAGEHLDELGGVERQEGHPGLPRHRARQQRLARPCAAPPRVALQSAHYPARQSCGVRAFCTPTVRVLQTTKVRMVNDV